MTQSWTAQVEWTRNGTHESTTVSVDGGSLRQATWDALKMVEDLTGGLVTGIEIHTTSDFRRRGATAPSTVSP